ncbi:hypothetical protein E9228_002755 [Curtobacterium flaccumfaciens]|uniref:LamG-like jellyroll fold domain-containing protein n=1 Tax=Curtobacterium salicis TaxID=1779862 RepID=A0ABX0T9D0_9MICO|nr:hypothetical protein [Curtobacterium sp. WW7]NII42097.1 hypothetical protein [Curtobacterium sp. WW7]
MLISETPIVLTDTTLPILRHGAGVSGYKHRWIMNEVTAAVDTVALTVPDYVGGVPFTGTSGPTVKALPSGIKYLQFDGSANTLTAAIPAGDALTVVMIARSRGTAGLLASGTGAAVGVGSSYVQFTGGTTVPVNLSAVNQWRFIAITADGTNATMTVDGTTATGAATAVFGNVLRLAANGTPANFSQLDVLEVDAYPTALNVSALASVRAAMKVRYGSILL